MPLSQPIPMAVASLTSFAIEVATVSNSLNTLVTIALGNRQLTICTM